MISKINEYENQIVSTIYHEMLVKNKTEKNILLQFNNFKNVYLSSFYDKNISVPILNNLVSSKDITEKYKYVDNIFVFNNFEKELFKDNQNVNILQIPIQENSDTIETQFDASYFKKFGYISNLIQDQPILIDIVSSFCRIALDNDAVVLFLMVEAENSDVASFKNNLYADLGINKKVSDRILWFSQGFMSDEVKIQFANSVDCLIYCTLSAIDNYLLKYCLVNNKPIYSQYKYFDEINLIKSHLRFIYNGSNLISYHSPDLNSLMKMFKDTASSTKKVTNYTNTGIMEYI